MRYRMRSIAATCLLPCLFSISTPGCGTRVVYQPTTGPVRLAEDVPARIYVKTADGRWVKGANKVLLHEGEYVLDLPAPRAPRRDASVLTDRSLLTTPPLAASRIRRAPVREAASGEPAPHAATRAASDKKSR